MGAREVRRGDSKAVRTRQRVGMGGSGHFCVDPLGIEFAMQFALARTGNFHAFP